MSYRIYQTEGLIVGSKNLGEASRLLYLITADFAFVAAAARGARRLESKLRYHLPNFIFGSFGLVRGRERWRLVSAQEDIWARRLLLDRDKRLIIVRISRLLSRLITGEAAIPALFADLKQAFVLLARDKLTAEELIKFELLLVLKILYHLGYLSPPQINGLRLERVDFWSRAVLGYSLAAGRSMLTVVNRALQSSQL